MSSDPPPKTAGISTVLLPSSGLPPPAPDFEDGERYEVVGHLGKGGMGDVSLVFDRVLKRRVARKVLRQKFAADAAAMARFIEEAQATAQLEHPNIIPVYDTGRTPEGEVFFTMKFVQGATLADALKSRSAGPGGIRALVSALHRVALAVGFAHKRGVVHRDLKPANVMIDDHGQVLVLDWGLVRVHAQDAIGSVETARSAGAHATLAGTIAGTPAYMAPEQARGELASIGPATDVYALGALLYTVLSGGRPYEGENAVEVLRCVVAGPPSPLVSGLVESTMDFTMEMTLPAPSGPELPPELVRICEKAMARRPEERYVDGDAFAREIGGWLDGDTRRARAEELCAEALEQLPGVARLHREAREKRAEAGERLANIPAWAAEEQKHAWWALEEHAEGLDQQAAMLDRHCEHLIAASLLHAPDLPEARSTLAARAMDAHRAAERRHDVQASSRALLDLRTHLSFLAELHPVRVEGAFYLGGTGTLSLRTVPSGAEVEIVPLVQVNRRLVEQPAEPLGPAPLRELSVPIGSYVCIIKHPGHATVRYPIQVTRGERWLACDARGRPAPVRLPEAGSLGAEDCFIPAGPFWAFSREGKGDDLQERRLWADDFVIRRFPVTNREYLAFLNDLVEQGEHEAAQEHAPRARGTSNRRGAHYYAVAPDGRFDVQVDAEGDSWHLDFPVVSVHWLGATAYAEWHAQQTGHRWRLPSEVEWAKAARGVDGRAFPWGDHADASWACTRASHRGKPSPAVVDSFPVDCSVYGVRGMGGNAEDWCADLHKAPYAPAQAPDLPTDQLVRSVRGGSWRISGSPALSRRNGLRQHDRLVSVGFRLARSLD